MYRITNPVNQTRLYLPNEEQLVQWLNTHICFYPQTKADLMRHILPVLNSPTAGFLGLQFGTCDEAYPDSFVFTDYIKSPKTSESKYMAEDRSGKKFFFKDLKEAYWWVLANGLNYCGFEPFRAKIGRALDDKESDGTYLNLQWYLLSKQKPRIKDGEDGILLLECF